MILRTESRGTRTQSVLIAAPFDSVSDTGTSPHRYVRCRYAHARMRRASATTRSLSAVDHATSGLSARPMIVFAALMVWYSQFQIEFVKSFVDALRTPNSVNVRSGGDRYMP